ncbi:gastrula zinc finger protein XlCGF66.1-like [Ranitomeya variabilis]|uniref:gastrula zinc finger protein XlCGF66.1-like n=1 Tax=Ranitomeya variabilis TaxID=490064 RepID=UPI004057B98F
MDRDKVKMAERILHLTLEILFRLTGEDYTVVKKTSSERCQDPESEGWGRPLSPIMRPPPHPLIHEDINDQKILELTYKMLELLTGEVPIRSQDVTIYFSMEEWEYLEGHKDLYEDIMMEVPQPLTSPDLSSKRTTPERCPSPLLPEDCKQEDLDVPQDHQDEDLTHINAIETYVRGDEWCKEEIPTYDYPDDYTRRSNGHLISSYFTADDLGITQATYEEHTIITDIPSTIYSKNVSSIPFKQSLSPDSLQTVRQSKRDKWSSNNTLVKSISCLTCGKCFTAKSSLVRHQICHTGEKPFSCSECGKCFTQKSSLVTHKRTHTGEKPYSCNECEKCYTKKSYLVRHQRVHRGWTTNSCSLCGKSYNSKSHLVAHQRTHTGELPYSSSECGKCFNEKLHLVRHQ